jgi:23S rRNA pseudouridine2605 synthase
VLSVRRDPTGRPCIDQVYPEMHPVGRLDYDTTGLLLFSSSGPLTQSLLHPKREIEKQYVATVTGTVDRDDLAAQLIAGVTTGEGVHTANLLSVEHMPEHQVADYLNAIRAELPSRYNQTDLQTRGYLDVLNAEALSTVTLAVSEGKHRMIRRVLANTGHPVVSLHRERLGLIQLHGLPVGQTRELTPAELRWAQQQLQRHRSSEKKSKVANVQPETDDEPLE